MRRRRLLVVGLVLMVVTLVGVGLSQGETSPPPGVAPEMWRPLSDGVGIAIRPGQAQGRQGPIVGTLMVREGDHWRPVDLVSGAPGLVPAR
jgi:hypothetical protein